MDVEALAQLILSVPDRAGMNGWTLVPAIAVDGDRCVFKIAGWLLNDGNPPPSNVQLGYTGLVSDINEAINIRGRDGLTTSVTLNGATYTQGAGNIALPDLLPISHNASATAHEDLRNIIAGIQALLESDDNTLDELKEIVDYIKANRTLIESITIDKISYTDIIDSLDSASSNKPLSANIGKALKAMVEAKQDKGDYATNAVVDQKISNIQLPDVGGAVGVHNTSSAAHSDIRTLISGKQDKGNYVLTTNASLTDSRNAKDVQAWAKAATKPTYTAVGLGNVNNTADSAKSTRVSRANNANADFYISIHANAYGSDWNDANGIETFVHSSCNRLSDSYKLADRVQKQLVITTGLRDRGVKSSSQLYVLNETKMDAMLIECGFMTNKKEAKLLKSTAYRKLCADAICKGLCEFLGKPYTGGVQMDKPTEAIPKWKIVGEKKLREMGATSQPHSPTEVVDYGSLGIILSNLMINK